MILKSMKKLFCLFLLGYLLPLPMIFSNTVYHLQKLSTAEGLSQQDVECIIQDKLGCIWIGSYDGLNRYTGNSLTVFRHNPTGNSVTDNRITALESWPERDEIWIGTEGRGLCCFNLKTEKFTNLPDITKNIREVITVLHRCDNKLWLGGQGNILKCLYFDDNNKAHVNTYKLPDVLNKSAFVWSIENDERGNILVGTNSGLYVKSPNSDNFQLAFSASEGVKLFPGHEGGIWAIIGGRLYFYSQQELQNVDYLKYPQPVNSFVVNKSIQSVCKVSENVYFVNTDSDIYKVMILNDHFKFEKIEFSDYSFFQNNSIRSLFIDNTMNVWINSNLEGVARFDLTQKNIYQLRFVDESFDKRLFIQDIVKDRQDRLWIGTNKGNYIYDTRGLSSMKHASGIDGPVFGLLNDSYGNIWCTTLNDILVYPKANDKRCKSILNQKGFPSTTNGSEGPYAICEDRERKIIWIGQRSGILQIKNYAGNETYSFKHYDCSYFGTDRLSNITAFLFLPEYNSLLITTASSGVFEGKLDSAGELISVRPLCYKTELQFVDHIWAIIRTSDGDIYMGTDSGLRQLLREGDEFVVTLTQYEDWRLQTCKITALVEDAQNYLWISTGQGLVSLNLNGHNTRVYTKDDGLATYIMTEGAYYDPRTNRLYAGGYGGLSVLDLSSLLVNEIPPKSFIQNVRINNRKIQTGEKLENEVILPFNVNYLSEICLQYNENNISFDVASLHFSTPGKNRFAYKLEGFMDKWVEQGESSTITFTNLPSGKYVLKIKSVNGDGVWEQNPLTLTIVVKPAPWLTWWAFLFYALVLLAIVYFIYRYYTEKKRAEYMRYVENMEHNKKMELAEMKLKYHTNITHELRTPLSLIAAPVQELIDKHYDDPFLNFRLQSIKNSTDRLLQLINQFLDLRKIVMDKYVLRVCYCRIDSCFYRIRDNFMPFAISRHISFNLYYDTDMTYCWCDAEVINKTCYNLISNAFKYTSSGGQVNLYVSADVDMKFLTVSVEDTGEGIEESALESIFDRFYQSPGSRGGTGIGLHLCKQLITLHHGSINVVSRKGEGTIFTVVLPVYRDAFTQDEIIEENVADKTEDTPENVEEVNPVEKERILVLIVEDNTELREYLHRALSEEYDVVTAENGEVGYNMAVNRIPDIIVSDIMMPVMDGIAFLEKIKENTLTCHIPFVLLTAKDSSENELEGLSKGADDYIVKPFNIQSLKYKIKNLVKLSAEGNARRTSSSEKPEVEKQLSERDKKFMDDFQRAVLDHISSSDFVIDDLCRIMNVSRMQLHRKTIAVFSKKPSQVVKEIRMKKAYELIAVGGCNITEAMQETGYTNHSYFAKLFVEVNGISPRELVEKRK